HPLVSTSFYSTHLASVSYTLPVTKEQHFLLQRVQPAMVGLIDGSLSTLAPIFSVAIVSHKPLYAFAAGLATSIGAAISMAFSEALSDTGELTGRGSPVVRGSITGVGTFLGGLFGHRLRLMLRPLLELFGDVLLVDQLEVRHLGRIAGAGAEAHDARVAAGPVLEPRGDIGEEPVHHVAGAQERRCLPAG